MISFHGENSRSPGNRITMAKTVMRDGGGGGGGGGGRGARVGRRGHGAHSFILSNGYRIIANKEEEEEKLSMHLVPIATTPHPPNMINKIPN